MIPQNNRWWKEDYKCRKKMRKEMIIRKSIKDTFKEYMKHSSLSGFRYIVDSSLNKKEKIVWLLLLLVTMTTFVHTVCTTWNEVLSKPLIVSMESTVYGIQNVDFPAVALCNVNRISKKAGKELAKELFPVANYSLEDIEQFIYNLGRLIDYEMHGSSELLKFFEALPERKSEGLLIERMRKLAPKCSELLLLCSWAGKAVPCSELFALRRTSHGHCCIFNYLLGYSKDGRLTRLDREVKKQKVAGLDYGLVVLMDPQTHDYAYPLHHAEGIDILLYDPLYFADHNIGPLIHHVIVPNIELHLELHSRVQLASREVRNYRPKTRKCYFNDEMQEKFGNSYSYGTCILTCRIKSVKSLCKCTPYFLPVHSNSSPVCTFSDLMCLNKYKEKLLYLYPTDAETTEGLEEEMEESLSCKDCLPDCEHTRHATKVSSVPLADGGVEKYLNYALMSGLNTTAKSLLFLYYPTPDATLDRLDVIFYWYELLSNFGGAAGVLMGFSIISSVEWVYFFCIRFSFILRYNLLKNNSR